MKNISMLNEEQNYDDLVQQIFNLIDYRDNLKSDNKLTNIDQQAKRNLSINLADRYLEDLVTAISKSYQTLFKFSYFLRKRDTTNKYSFNLLNGQVRQSNLVELILNNRWNPNRNCMDVDRQSKNFFFLHTKKYNFLLNSNESI